MPNYATAGEVPVSTPATLISLTPEGTGARFKIYEWMVGSMSTAPADVALAWTVARSTVAGTGGGATVAPLPLDQGDVASRIVSYQGPTSEPTYTSDEELIEVNVNERATFRWVAAPGSELISDGTTSAGLGLHVEHATDTDLVKGTVMFAE